MLVLSGCLDTNRVSKCAALQHLLFNIILALLHILLKYVKILILDVLAFLQPLQHQYTVAIQNLRLQKHLYHDFLLIVSTTMEFYIKCPVFAIHCEYTRQEVRGLDPSQSIKTGITTCLVYSNLLNCVVKWLHGLNRIIPVWLSVHICNSIFTLPLAYESK